MENKKNRYWSLFLCIVVCFSAAALGSLFTSSSVNGWYKTIKKPDLSPPNWVFGPVWSTLFLAMSISLWLIWLRRRNTAVTSAIVLFATQLILNVAWSGFFFGMQNPFLALCDIVLLLIAIAATSVAFFKISKVAGWLLIPYFIWVCFASYLNYAIWSLNAV